MNPVCFPFTDDTGKEMRDLMSQQTELLAAIAAGNAKVVSVTSEVIGGVEYGIVNLAGRRKEAMAEDRNVKIAVKALLRGQVMDLGLHYISKGYIPPYGLETLRNYYDPYVALGDGDPSIKHIVETCESLPVHSGEMEVNT